MGNSIKANGGEAGFIVFAGDLILRGERCVVTKAGGLTVGDLAALGRLFDEYRPRLLAMVWHRIDPALAGRVDAEDILSETFLRASRKWPDFCAQPAVTPYAWLYRITLDCLIDAWRNQTQGRRDHRRDMPWPDRSSVQLGMGLVNVGTSPSEAAIREELRIRIRSVMQCLSHRDQEILWMRHYDDLSFKEAGMVLGISENAATVRYARALRRLKDQWLRTQKGLEP